MATDACIILAGFFRLRSRGSIAFDLLVSLSTYGFREFFYYYWWFIVRVDCTENDSRLRVEQEFPVSNTKALLWCDCGFWYHARGAVWAVEKGSGHGLTLARSYYDICLISRPRDDAEIQVDRHTKIDEWRREMMAFLFPSPFLVECVDS